MAGIPCAFIRLSGCNLRCRYCDTRYAWEGGDERSVLDLAAWANATGLNTVEITGGEPLLQPGTNELAERLLESGLRVMVETNGSVSIAGLPPGVMVVMDIKTPGSGEESSLDLVNLERLRPGDNIKFVITSREDYDWACTMVLQRRLHGVCEVIFSPAQGQIAPRALAEWIVEDRLPVRLQVQLHKILWPEERRGV